MFDNIYYLDEKHRMQSNPLTIFSRVKREGNLAVIEVIEKGNEVCGPEDGLNTIHRFKYTLELDRMVIERENKYYYRTRKCDTCGRIESVKYSWIKF